MQRVPAVEERVHHGDVPAPATGAPAPVHAEAVSFGYGDDAPVLDGATLQVQG